MASPACPYLGVESHFRYGNLLWDHVSATKLHNSQKLQDRAITLIQSAHIKDRIPSATLSANESVTSGDGVLNEQCTEILKRKFTKRSQVSKYETRGVRACLHEPGLAPTRHRGSALLQSNLFKRLYELSSQPGSTHLGG